MNTKNVIGWVLVLVAAFFYVAYQHDTTFQEGRTKGYADGYITGYEASAQFDKSTDVPASNSDVEQLIEKINTKD